MADVFVEIWDKDDDHATLYVDGWREISVTIPKERAIKLANYILQCAEEDKAT